MNEPVYGLTAEAAKVLQDMANEHRQRLPDVGRRTRRVALVKQASVTIDGAPTCGTCFQIDGSYPIEILPGLFAAETYLVTILCGESPVAVDYDGMDGDDHVWTSGSISVNCNGGSTSITVTLTISGKLPGEVVVTTSGSGGDGEWDNEVAFQPKTNTNLRLKNYEDGCPCAPFDPHPCLTPSPGV